MSLTKPPVLPVWSESGDKIRPSNAELQAGWPLSNVPPSRQRFNWILNFLANGIRYLTRRGISDWDIDETYEIGDYCRGPDGVSYKSLTQNTGKTPAANTSDWIRWGLTSGDLIVEAHNQTEEDAAFAAGAAFVIRLDLLTTTTTTAGGTTTTTTSTTTTTAAPYTTALLLHFDGTNGGSTFTDSSSFARTMTKTGTPTTNTSGPKFGTAKFDFTGNANFLTTPDASNLRFGSGDWSIECWHKMSSAGMPGSVHSYICSKGASGSLNNAWYFAILTGGYLSFNPANNASGIYVPYAYVDDTTNWHHLSLNSVGGVVTMYVDGASVGSCIPGSSGLPSIYEGTGPLYVGAWNYGTASTRGDYMDEFIITTGGALRHGNFTPPAAPF